MGFKPKTLQLAVQYATNKINLVEFVLAENQSLVTSRERGQRSTKMLSTACKSNSENNQERDLAMAFTRLNTMELHDITALLGDF